MASYPNTVKSFATHVDNSGEFVMAAHINDIQAEVAAVESQLITSKLNTWTNDGWIPASGSWTINTAASGIINVPDSSIFDIGNPVKLTNSSVKQFYVVAKPSSTTITVYAGSDFALVGAAGTALTACFYSKVATPLGFLQWFNYTPTISGGTLGNGTRIARFALFGRSVHLQFMFTLGSTSAISGDFYFTFPIQAANVMPNFNAQLNQSGVNNFLGLTDATSSACYIRALQVTGSQVILQNLSSTFPWSWKTNDYLRTSGWYEIA